MKIVESGAKTIALLVGGWWTYNLFVRKRAAFPKVELSHEFFLIDQPDDRVLHVVVRLKNTGEVLVPITQGFCRTQLVKPVDDVEGNHHESQSVRGKLRMLRVSQGAEIDWPMLEERSITLSEGECGVEPNEVQEFPFDFPFSPATEVVKIYSFIQNDLCRASGKTYGWSKSSLVDLNKLKDATPTNPSPGPQSETHPLGATTSTTPAGSGTSAEAAGPRAAEAEAGGHAPATPERIAT